MSLDLTLAEQINNAIQAVQDHDETEGEVHVHVSKKPRRINPINAFALCFTGSLAEIIRLHKLSPTAILLLLKLLDLGKHGNLVSVNQKGLAKQLKVQQPAISKAIRRLVNAGVILELTEGQYFNPQLITKQGLATVARSHPAAVVAGIAALKKAGMDPNWNPQGQ